jgi:hypothetical protein
MRSRKDAIVECLTELSDESLQRRRWLAEGVDPSGAVEMSSFEEAVCGLFDDTGLSGALEKGATGFGEDVDRQLRELHKLLNPIDSRRSPKEIMSDPRMARVRKISSDLLRMIG